MDTHLVLVDADDKEAAGRKVTEALEGKTIAFELLNIERTG